MYQKKSSSVSARKLKCPARLGNFSAQLSTAWEISAQTHYLPTYLNVDILILNVNKYTYWHFLTTYPPHLVHVDFERPLNTKLTNWSF